MNLSGPRARGGDRERPGRRALNVATSLAAIAWMLVSLAGCGGEPRQLVELRQRLVMAERPGEVSSIEEARQQVSDRGSVVFEGRIAGADEEAFVPGSASFLVTEILAEDPAHAGKQHVDNCPFCKRKAAEAPRAAVRFVDESGEPLAVDARKLFGIQSGDKVVIRGEGELIGPMQMFQVTADAIYVPPRTAVE